ncbi:MAG: hypothetical protein M3P40_11320 [Actinomycetota bacterium]|nr:hypothetical protein [Actinomycetota bacterium]
MPCKIYLRADEDAIYCNDAPDVVVRRIEEAGEQRFIQVSLTPFGHEDAARTAYVSPIDVTAVLPLHPREFDAMLDDPPDWFTD